MSKSEHPIAPTAHNSKREALLAILAELAPRERATLEAMKAEAQTQLQRPDLLWHLLLESFATWGRGGGWDGLIGDPANYSRVTFEAVGALPPDEREETLAAIFRQARVRYPNIKARSLAASYDHMLSLGGPEQATQHFLSLTDRDEIIRFLSRFKGIGPKYVRAIPMDIYHPAFREAIAIDARIQRISQALNLPYGPRDYQPHEAYYLSIAQQAHLSGWDLDRLLYYRYKEILTALES